jgi:hypothetical protein
MFADPVRSSSRLEARTGSWQQSDDNEDDGDDDGDDDGYASPFY